LERLLRSRIIRAVCSPVSPLLLIFFEYLEYELLTHNAAAPEIRAPRIITTR
jgi:hypothetical protein